MAERPIEVARPAREPWRGHPALRGSGRGCPSTRRIARAIGLRQQGSCVRFERSAEPTRQRPDRRAIGPGGERRRRGDRAIGADRRAAGRVTERSADRPSHQPPAPSDPLTGRVVDRPRRAVRQLLRAAQLISGQRRRLIEQPVALPSNPPPCPSNPLSRPNSPDSGRAIRHSDPTAHRCSRAAGRLTRAAGHLTLAVGHLTRAADCCAVCPAAACERSTEPNSECPLLITIRGPDRATRRLMRANPCVRERAYAVARERTSSSPVRCSASSIRVPPMRRAPRIAARCRNWHTRCVRPWSTVSRPDARTGPP